MLIFLKSAISAPWVPWNLVPTGGVFKIWDRFGHESGPDGRYRFENLCILISRLARSFLDWSWGAPGRSWVPPEDPRDLGVPGIHQIGYESGPDGRSRAESWCIRKTQAGPVIFKQVQPYEKVRKYGCIQLSKRSRELSGRSRSFREIIRCSQVVITRFSGCSLSDFQEWV